MNGNGIMWCAAGIPAILGWVVYGFAFLIAPHLTVDVSPLMWAGFAVGFWYILCALFVTGTSFIFL